MLEGARDAAVVGRIRDRLAQLVAPLASERLEVPIGVLTGHTIVTVWTFTLLICGIISPRHGAHRALRRVGGGRSRLGSVFSGSS